MIFLKRNLLGGAITALVFTALGCGKPPSSALSVHNGEEVSDPSGAVRKLSDGCSGSFVAPRVFVTAAHCSADQVLAHDEGLYLSLVDCEIAEEFDSSIRHGQPGDWRVCGTDGDAPLIGVTRYLNASQKPPESGEMVSFLGYGQADMVNKTGLGTLRKGSALLDYASDQVLKVTDVPALTGQATAPGDSGGPWLNTNGEMIGITRSAVLPKSFDDLIAVQATSVRSKGFLAAVARAKKKYAASSGKHLQGSDENGLFEEANRTLLQLPPGSVPCGTLKDSMIAVLGRRGYTSWNSSDDGILNRALARVGCYF